MWIRSHYHMAEDKDTGLSQNQGIVEAVAGYCFWNNGIIKKKRYESLPSRIGNS
jgi:hypothetical protein